MYQQVNFHAEPSATVAGQWIGVVLDERGRVLTRTGLTYDTSDQARFGARIKWLGRSRELQVARGMLGSVA